MSRLLFSGDKVGIVVLNKGSSKWYLIDFADFNEQIAAQIKAVHREKSALALLRGS
jgi:hypothetical protein